MRRLRKAAIGAWLGKAGIVVGAAGNALLLVALLLLACYQNSESPPMPATIIIRIGFLGCPLVLLFELFAAAVSLFLSSFDAQACRRAMICVLLGALPYLLLFLFGSMASVAAAIRR